MVATSPGVDRAVRNILVFLGVFLVVVPAFAHLQALDAEAFLKVAGRGAAGARLRLTLAVSSALARA